MINKTIYEFGTVKSDATVKFEFDWLGTEDDIETIKAGCGCADAFFDKKSGKIKGYIEIARAGAYQDGENALSKWVNVWLNDGKPRQIADDKKREKPNPHKGRLRLQISGTVIK